MSKLKLNCEDANHICDKTQYREAGLWDKIILNLHLIYCRACRKYTSKNSKLTKLMKNSKVQTLDNSSKEKLQLTFEKELAKQKQ